jgi:hypothetical protein
MYMQSDKASTISYIQDIETIADELVVLTFLTCFVPNCSSQPTH